MSNPFAINPYQAYANTANMSVNSTQIGGSNAGSIWGNPGSMGVTSPVNNPQIGSSFNKELNDVSAIGAQKKGGYMNGLGGTNDPGDHKLFLVG